MKNTHANEISDGDRFEFGANWMRFLSSLTENRIMQAEISLRKLLGHDILVGKSFLDAGSGSGIFSLAARRLGARVHSFDYDPQSVACTRTLKQRFFAKDPLWTIEEGSVLDANYLNRLGHFDIVYSWGVLHHTGAMWSALENVVTAVAPSGQLFISIYNDQGWISRYWLFVKKMYVQHSQLRWLLVLLHAPYLFGLRWLVRLLSGQGKLSRGMNLWHDMVDWVGGYPFEVARPEELFHFYQHKGFQLQALTTCGGRHGCNELVFTSQTRSPENSPPRPY